MNKDEIKQIIHDHYVNIGSIGGKAHWDKSTLAERKAHAKMMLDKRWGKGRKAKADKQS